MKECSSICRTPLISLKCQAWAFFTLIPLLSATLKSFAKTSLLRSFGPPNISTDCCSVIGCLLCTCLAHTCSIRSTFQSATQSPFNNAHISHPIIGLYVEVIVCIALDDLAGSSDSFALGVASEAMTDEYGVVCRICRLDWYVSRLVSESAKHTKKWW